MIPKIDSVGQQRGRFQRRRISVFFMEDGEIAYAFCCVHCRTSLRRQPR